MMDYDSIPLKKHETYNKSFKKTFDLIKEQDINGHMFGKKYNYHQHTTKKGEQNLNLC